MNLTEQYRDLLERYLAVLVGLLAGDVVGAPRETQSKTVIRAEIVASGGSLEVVGYESPFVKGMIFPPGRPTDDSEFAAGLATSLIACGCDMEDQYRRYREIVQGKGILWSGKPDSFGRTTRALLEAPTFAQSQQIKWKHSPSNGSLMRSAALALYYGGNLEALTNATYFASHVTHCHLRAVECCTVYVHFLNELLRGVSSDAAWKNGIKNAVHFRIRLCDSDLLDFLKKDPTTEPDVPPDIGVRSRVVLTLQVAVWAVLTTKSFEEGIVAAISVGGDTDTYAAVAGALLGARYGYDAIPKRWRDALIGRSIMECLAGQLFEECGKRDWLVVRTQ